MYEIGYYSDGNHLSINNKNYLVNVLNEIIKYEVIDEKLYILSEEGFAIIDKNNLCRIYVTVPEEEFISGYNTDSDGNNRYINGYIENEHIQYLSDFNGFSTEEQKIFNKIKIG